MSDVLFQIIRFLPIAKLNWLIGESLQERKVIFHVIVPKELVALTMLVG